MAYNSSFINVFNIMLCIHVSDALVHARDERLKRVQCCKLGTYPEIEI